MPSPITVADLLTIPGIAAVIVLLIQILKSQLPADWIQWFAIGLGVVLGVVAVAILGPYTVEAFFNGGLRGLIAGGFAVGAYQALKPFNVLKSREEQITPPSK